MSITATLWSLSAVVLGLFGIMAVLTISLSAYKQRADRSREAARTSIRNEFFERQRRDDPEWKEWVAALSTAERAELASLLDRYLRLVTGSQREKYLELAAVLELGANADAALDDPYVATRLQALATLTVLDHPVSIDRLLETCTDTRATREAAARLLYEHRDEYDAPAEWGTRLLLWEGNEPITIYGLETLSALNTDGVTPLLAQGRAYVSAGERTIVTQVCLVLEHSVTVEPAASFEWLLALLDHEDPTVRAAGIRAFKQQGWRTELRDQIDLAALVTDESPAVRRATYEVLTYWGDRDARNILEWAVIDERDRRAQLVAVRGLASLEADPLRDQPGWPTESWAWVRSELEISGRQRLPSPPEEEVVP